MSIKPKIAISARGLGDSPTGPGAYTNGFVQQFLRQAGDYEVHLYYDNRQMAGSFPGAVEHVLPGSNVFLWDHFLLPRQVRRDRIDLTIFPKGTISLFLSSQALPIMLDLGYFYPRLNAYKPLHSVYMRLAMRYAARRSKGILTISENTRRDVIRLLHVAPEKVTNIYGAAAPIYAPVTDPAVRDQVRERYGLVEPFIFFPTSSISPRKNINRVLDAFEAVQNHVPHHLYLTGGEKWNASGMISRIQGPIARRVHHIGTVATGDMPALYSLAEFTIYPSLFEGLGLPVLEAFQCGSPVLTSEQTSLPEVAGEAALLVDAYSARSIADGILRLANEPGLRADLRAKGFIQAKEFTWEKTVEKVIRWLRNNL